MRTAIFAAAENPLGKQGGALLDKFSIFVTIRCVKMGSRANNEEAFEATSAVKSGRFSFLEYYPITASGTDPGTKLISSQTRSLSG